MCGLCFVVLCLLVRVGCWLLYVACCALCVVCCGLFACLIFFVVDRCGVFVVVYCLLRVAYCMWLSFRGRCFLLIVYSVLFVAMLFRCLLCVDCRLSFGVCYVFFL